MPSVLLAIVLTCSPSSRDVPVYKQPAGKRILFLGDSITQNGLYVGYIEYFLRRENPEQNFDIISIGLSSETVSGLTEPNHPYPRPCILDRLQRALDSIQPDVVSACYGMNDGIYFPQSEERFAAFQTGMRTLVETVQQTGAQLYLLTPPPFDPLPIAHKTVEKDAEFFGYSSPFAGYNDVLRDYAAWLRDEKIPGIRIIDFFTPMVEYIEGQRLLQPNFCLAPDGVHPDSAGHLLMARIFLEGLDMAVPQDERVTMVHEVSKDSLFSLVEKRRKIRSKAWLEYIGYTRGETVQKDNRTEAENEAERLLLRIKKLRDMD